MRGLIVAILLFAAVCWTAVDDSQTVGNLHLDVDLNALGVFLEKMGKGLLTLIGGIMALVHGRGAVDKFRKRRKP